MTPPSLPWLALALLSCGAPESVNPEPPNDARRPIGAAVAGPRAVSGDRIAARIRAAFALTQAAVIRTIERSSGDAQALIRTRIAARLLPGAVELGGADRFFTPADGLERHLGVLTLRYPDAATAQQRANSIADQHYFNDSKILIPMASARHGDTLIIAFTEAGGDPKLSTLIADTASGWAADRSPS